MTTIDRDAALALQTHPVVATLAATFTDAGHQLLLVGGSVRDALTGGQVDDLDFTTDATPERIRELVGPLGPIWDAGQAFGTIGVSLDGEKVEITTFRAERYDTGSRKPQVAYSTDVADDLVRRDLTINAIALDVTAGTLVDPFDGAGDLARGQLRCPGDPDMTMSEDPLRQVRVVRFAARTGFAVDPTLRAAVVSHRDRLAIVARERLTAELRKLVAGGPAVLAAGLRLAVELGIEQALLGPLADARTIDALAAAGPQAPALAVVAHGRDSARSVLAQLKLSSDEIDDAVGTADLAGRLAAVAAHGHDRDVVRALARATHGRADLAPAVAVAAAHGHDVTDAADRVARVARDEPDVVAPLPIDGHDLLAAGLSGPAIGAGLRAAEAVLLAAGTLDRHTALAVATA